MKTFTAEFHDFVNKLILMALIINFFEDGDSKIKTWQIGCSAADGWNYVIISGITIQIKDDKISESMKKVRAKDLL